MKFKAYKMYFEAETLYEVEDKVSDHEIDHDFVTHLFIENEINEKVVKVVSTHCDPTLCYVITEAQ